MYTRIRSRGGCKSGKILTIGRWCTSTPTLLSSTFMQLWAKALSLVCVPPTRGEGGNDPKDKTNFKSQQFLEAVEQLKLQIQDIFSGRARYKVVLDHARQHTSN
jgi:hypothetical protein